MLVEPSHAWTPKQKLLIAAGVVAGLIAIAALLYGYQFYNRPKRTTGIQQTEDLGFGFRRVIIAKMNKGQLVQHPFFCYKDRFLCQIDGAASSVSPSGNFGVCQDVRSGKLMLFRRRDEKELPLTTTAFGLASRFVWHEDQATVEAVVGNEGMSGIFPLQ